LAARGRGRDRRSLGAARSLTRVDACNPLLQAHPTWARDEHEGRGIPTSLTPVSGRLASPPFALALTLDPSGLGHAATLTRRPKGPPGLGTPTHMWSTWDRLTAVSTYGPPGSEEDDKPDSGWDFSGLGKPSVMQDFMTACDYCLSDYFDDGHSLDDEDYGPSRKCFHVDLGGLDEGNHLGMSEDDDPPRPAPRVDILQELAVVPVPARGQDTQLEQIREMQAKLDEEAGQLVQLRQNIGQEWAGRALAGEARHPAQDVQHRIADNARARLPPTSSGVSQNLVVAAILLRAMPEPSTTEGRHIQGRTQESPGGCHGPTGQKLCLPKARVPPGASRRDFPIHAGSLGSHRAHTGHNACSPWLPRQRAPPPRPSSPPRREGASRLPPQAWGTLR
jgi:hypothetical protein